jgi:hypothetical protein
MLRRIWIVLGAVALVIIAYITAFAVEEVQQPLVADGTAEGAANATTWTVCSNGCDFTSIQAAVDAASSGDTIELGAETFHENIDYTDRSLRIRGAGMTATIVDGGGLGPVFENRFRGRLELADMTIRNGSTGGVRGGSYGRVSLDNCLVTDNDSSGIAGHDVVISRSMISGNSGAVDVYPRGSVGYYPYYVDFGSAAISTSIISDNGGGIAAYISELGIGSTTISGNSGYGIYADYSLVYVTSSTISGNGVGIYSSGYEGQVSIDSSTITDNDSVGIASYRGSSTSLKGNILARNLGGDCLISYCSSCPGQSLGHNIASDDTCDSLLDQSSDLTSTDSLLLPLANNGGPTPTHALGPGSPAIDAGGDECLPTDQRGALRPQDGDGDGIAKCDIGAYEVDILTLNIDIKPTATPTASTPTAAA